MNLQELGSQPISDANPGGIDARYEPEYDALQLEIDKLSSATAATTGEIDWKHVVGLSHTLLSEKTKDMKVASYLGVALLNLKGIEGMSTGARILYDLTTNFWDTMYPELKRVRGRFNAVSWWSEYCEKYLQEYEGDAVPAGVVSSLVESLKGLDETLSEKSDEAPILRGLIQLAGGLPVQAEEASPEEGQEQTGETEGETSGDAPSSGGGQSTQDAPSSAPSGAAPQVEVTAVGAITNHDEYRSALKTSMAPLGTIAEYLLANDPVDAIGYRLRRIAAWLPIAAVPPNENGKTLIPAPDAMEKDTIVHLIEARNFQGALEATETRIGQYLFWLDLSRLAAEALESLGGVYSDAQTVIETEVWLFVKRLKGIENMTFADGTPFADGKTRSWINSLNRQEADDILCGDAEAASAKAFAKAAKLAKGKKVLEGVSVLQMDLANAPSGKERFLLRLGMIRLLTDVDQSALARTHVEEVLERIKEYQLELWDPDLALNGYRTVYEALSTEGGDEALALAAETLRRIGRINPAAALKINGMN